MTCDNKKIEVIMRDICTLEAKITWPTFRECLI